MSMDTLSKRALHTLKLNENLPLAPFADALWDNMYQAESNPQGIIDFGTALNRLLEPEIQQRLRQDDVPRFNSEEHQHYFDFSGKPPFRKAIAEFLNRYFKPFKQVMPEEVIVVNGGSSCLDILAYCLLDPKDVYITATPTYTRIFTDLHERFLGQPAPLIPLNEYPQEDESFILYPEALEPRIESLKAQGYNPRAFLLVNPSNPLGDIYSPEVVTKLMEVCAKHQIHFIVDEIYALSVVAPDCKFQSVIAMESIPDPERTHLVWGFTKDLGLAGLRIGVIHTKNEILLRSLRSLGFYYMVPSLVHDLGTTLLNDHKWYDEVYFPLNRERLYDRYMYSKGRLEDMGLSVRPLQAGLFLWVNASRFLQPCDKNTEFDLFRELFAEGVFIVPGSQYYCHTAGWMRIVFTVLWMDLKEGLDRMERVFNRRCKAMGLKLEKVKSVLDSSTAIYCTEDGKLADSSFSDSKEILETVNSNKQNSGETKIPSFSTESIASYPISAFNNDIIYHENKVNIDSKDCKDSSIKSTVAFNDNSFTNSNNNISFSCNNSIVGDIQVNSTVDTLINNESQKDNARNLIQMNVNNISVNAQVNKEISPCNIQNNISNSEIKSEEIHNIGYTNQKVALVSDLDNKIGENI